MCSGMGNHESNLKNGDKKGEKKKKFRQKDVSDVVQNVEVPTENKVKKKKLKFKFRRNRDKKKKEAIIDNDAKNEVRLLNGEVPRKSNEFKCGYGKIEKKNAEFQKPVMVIEEAGITEKENKRNSGILKLYCSDQNDPKKAARHQQNAEETKTVNIKPENVVKTEILSNEVSAKSELTGFTRKETAVLQCLQGSSNLHFHNFSCLLNSKLLTKKIIK